ncbi:energy transducer TonB [Frateuria defendens]|uniref:energy transducer TonB n=1 Tax=Frateuria defendens TaxID=2219559 RepID=UPI00066FF14B|nr:energy transducer TonB [Frateuria defendens]
MNVFRLLRPLLPLAALAAAAPALAQSAQKIGPQQINRHWILLNQSVDIDIPNSARNIDKPGCAAVSFTIGSDGVPRNLKVEKATPGGDFGTIAVNAVSRFRYGPSLGNHDGNPVATYYIVPFNAPDGPQGQQQVMAPCSLPGYAG